jgi:tRNA-dihydrouridine synthase B
MIAPMVGISHVAFRELIRSYTPVGVRPLIFTEMLSTRRLPSERLDSVNELRTALGEDPFVPQLLGNEECFIRPSIEKLETVAPWGFDINMGCPADHVLKHNWGVRLLGDKNYAAEVVRITKRCTTKPVSVKLRGGAEASLDAAWLCDFTAALEDAGVDWLTIHARPKAKGHSGEANWQLVSQVAAARKIPVVANGDVQTADDVMRLIDPEFGVDGVMIARAATARPWILWQVAERLGFDASPPGRAGERAPQTRDEEAREYLKACLKFISIMRVWFDSDEYIRRKFSFFAATGARWFPFGHAFWGLTTKAKTVDHLVELIGGWQEKPQMPVYGRIDL